MDLDRFGFMTRKRMGGKGGGFYKIYYYKHKGPSLSLHKVKNDPRAKTVFVDRSPAKYGFQCQNNFLVNKQFSMLTEKIWYCISSIRKTKKSELDRGK
jgi:hypothetical protein